MTYRISPGIQVREIDLTTIVPAAATSVGGFAGAFKWGPLNQILIISNEAQLAQVLGKPDNDTAASFFTAANFLAYSNNLLAVRVADEATALNATADGAGVLIRNDDEYDSAFAAGGNGVGNWAAKYAGVLGNDIKVSICPSEAAFSQAATITTLGANIVGDSPATLVDQLAVGSIVVSSAGVRRKVSAITAGTSEALTTTGTAVDGTGTSFETTLSVGMILESAGEYRHIVAIADDENATLNAAFTVDIAAPTALDTLVLALDSAFPAPLASNAATLRWEFADSIGSAPNTSDFAANNDALNDEMHIVVVDVTGKLSGVKNAILERFAFVSKAGNAKSFDGSSNHYVDVVNRQSQYVRWMDHLPAGTNWGNDAVSGVSFASPSAPATDLLTGGVDGSSLSDADKIRGFDLFSDAESVDVSLIMAGDASLAVQIHLINNIAEVRQDCLVLLSPPEDAVVNNSLAETADIIAHRDNLPSSSYAVLDSGWKYQYDKYNDVTRWLPLNGDIAGLCARTDLEADPWFSPAGFNRGNIKNIIKLAWSPKEAERDALYVKGINPVVRFLGLGTVLYGDKTLLAKPSAFDRINVRRLFNILKKSIRAASQFTLFEINDSFQRAQFKALVEPFLRDIQGRRGITDFKVVCDATNNTPQVIDSNSFVGDIYVVPARSINFIQLNFVAVRNGVDFSEVVGQF